MILELEILRNMRLVCCNADRSEIPDTYSHKILEIKSSGSCSMDGPGEALVFWRLAARPPSIAWSLKPRRNGTVRFRVDWRQALLLSVSVEEDMVRWYQLSSAEEMITKLTVCRRFEYLCRVCMTSRWRVRTCEIGIYVRAILCLSLYTISNSHCT